MSMVPMMFRNWWDDMSDAPMRSSWIMDQHFGSGITSDDLMTAMSAAAAARSALQNPSRTMYNRPWRNSSMASLQDIGSTVKADKEKFQINLDVQQFTPNEISVMVSQNSIVIEGKHEEKQDEHGFISRQFKRRYMLPAGHDANQIKSSISSDGILTVMAPMQKALKDSESQKSIPIIQTGQPMKKISGSQEHKDGIRA
ncbi:protein lethal(2)essential for life-like [Ochlerotatus camptorhynchus]|uniref:protein lethal(2)essential for life-like n=1 Tax=Ochlerotatus camptorhynchus TaxID=644619 RepID=UPI0031D39B53